jgi:acetyltransferase
VSEYPKDTEEEITLGGTPLLIRPIRHDDLERELEFVHGLSPDTAYLRFFSPLHDLSPAMAAAFVDVDYARTMAFIALENGTKSAIAGVARYVALSEAPSCEFAVTIADRWQRRGLGLILMQRLIDYARRRGFREMTGSVLHANQGMRVLATKLGFVAHSDPEDPSAVLMRLDLRAGEHTDATGAPA